MMSLRLHAHGRQGLTEAATPGVRVFQIYCIKQREPHCFAIFILIMLCYTAAFNCVLFALRTIVRLK